ncbi:sigma-70 family RNA polymerase sigma factor [Verrucomicrobiaceae bacterium N1E253]|uniref:Sigma-70 family RNA polymerase sigma factor n=1 Tax=Oceaniferula marina TaxID=2748318 RepID=A0A851GS44_9BACT|nr:sigma-70 family RNA polymerase sigma factor [Oceaniferula marina]NWK57600.1 sigma-70 family RNA polymerase sigma factor [Oceaniferula marina]
MADAPIKEDAFVKLLVSHQDLIHAFVVSLMPGSSETEDVVQEVNEILWSKRDSFELGTNFKAWSLTTARFHVMTHQRKRKRDRWVVFEEEVCEAIQEEALEANMAASNKKLTHLNECISLLQAKDQELIIHRYWKKSGLSKYAQASGRSEQAIRAALYRIRIALRKCVQKKSQQANHSA